MVVFQAASQEKQKRIAFLTTRINPNLPISIWILAYLESHLCRMKTHHVLHFFRAANRFYRTFIAK